MSKITVKNMQDDAAFANSGMNYTLYFQNNSSNAGSVIVFQQDPGIGVANVFPLAWFAKYTYPQTNAQFTWQINYNFVWEDTGDLVPGVVFSATQNPSADLTSSNQITLAYDPQNAAYHFIQQQAGPQPGNLYISQDGSVPLSQATVGIGMSGAGTFVVQAQPNIDLTFTPHPKYYVAFGTFQQGEVLDIQALSHVKEVAFPAGVYSMKAILNPDNSWTIASSKAVNKALAITRRYLPQLFKSPRSAVDDLAVTLKPGDSVDIAGTAEVTVRNETAKDGAVQVKSPNVPPANYALPPHDQKQIQVPVGDSRFTDIGTVDLSVSW